MFQRFLSIGHVPELRSDPALSDKVGYEIELFMPIDVYWKLEEIIKEMRYARVNGNSTLRLWAQFSKQAFPFIITEKDRQWYRRNVLKSIY